jgi:S-formylglutathione hydrolase FrmB
MSRGLAGHSMGGYGTIRLGMKYSDVFSSIYAMSACCLAPTLARPDPAAEAKVEAVHNLEDFAQADLRTRAVFALAAAWSPDPKNPPFFLDLPYKNGEAQPAIAAEWAANSPLAMIHQYIPNLRRLHAIMFDVGSNDRLVGSSTDVQLDSLLTLYGIPHTYETYDGDHESGIALRLEKSVLPFFSTNLTFPAARH